MEIDHHEEDGDDDLFANLEPLQVNATPQDKTLGGSDSDEWGVHAVKTFTVPNLEGDGEDELGEGARTGRRQSLSQHFAPASPNPRKNTKLLSQLGHAAKALAANLGTDSATDGRSVAPVRAGSPRSFPSPFAPRPPQETSRTPTAVLIDDNPPERSFSPPSAGGSSTQAAHSSSVVRELGVSFAEEEEEEDTSPNEEAEGARSTSESFPEKLQPPPLKPGHSSYRFKLADLTGQPPNESVEEKGDVFAPQTAGTARPGISNPRVFVSPSPCGHSATSARRQAALTRTQSQSMLPRISKESKVSTPSPHVNQSPQGASRRAVAKVPNLNTYTGPGAVNFFGRSIGNNATGRSPEHISQSLVDTKASVNRLLAVTAGYSFLSAEKKLEKRRAREAAEEQFLQGVDSGDREFFAREHSFFQLAAGEESLMDVKGGPNGGGGGEGAGPFDDEEPREASSPIIVTPPAGPGHSPRHRPPNAKTEKYSQLGKLKDLVGAPAPSSQLLAPCAPGRRMSRSSISGSLNFQRSDANETNETPKEKQQRTRRLTQAELEALHIIQLDSSDDDVVDSGEGTESDQTPSEVSSNAAMKPVPPLRHEQSHLFKSLQDDAQGPAGGGKRRKSAHRHTSEAEGVFSWKSGFLKKRNLVLLAGESDGRDASPKVSSPIRTPTSTSKSTLGQTPLRRTETKGGLKNHDTSFDNSQGSPWHPAYRRKISGGLVGQTRPSFGLIDVSGCSVSRNPREKLLPEEEDQLEEQHFLEKGMTDCVTRSFHNLVGAYLANTPGRLPNYQVLHPLEHSAVAEWDSLPVALQESFALARMKEEKSSTWNAVRAMQGLAKKQRKVDTPPPFRV